MTITKKTATADKIITKELNNTEADQVIQERAELLKTLDYTPKEIERMLRRYARDQRRNRRASK